MTNWFSQHLHLVYQFYGASFLLLGACALAIPNRLQVPFSRILWLLGLFGLVHGIQEFIDAERHLDDSPTLIAVSACFAFFSFWALFEFGRRALQWKSRHAYLSVIVALIAILLSTQSWVAMLAIGGRYVLGIPGALMAGYALLLINRQFRHSDETSRFSAQLLAFMLLTYAALSVFVDAELRPPGWPLPDKDWVLNTLGLPVALLRAITAFSAMSALIALVSRANSGTVEDLDNILSGIDGFVYRCKNDQNWTMLYIGGSTDDLTGYGGTDFRNPDGATLASWIHPDDRATVWQHVQQALGAKQSFELTYRMVTQAGRIRWVSERGKGVYNSRGELLYLQGHVINADELVNARLAAQREQGRMSALLSAMNIGILFEDRLGRVEYVNPAFRKMWAIDDSIELIGAPTRDVLEHSTHQFSRPDHASRHILQIMDTHEISERFELDLYDGRILTQLSYPVADSDGRPIGRLWIYEDVTHERQTAQQLVYLAEHDPLTGLHNRHRFQDHLERMILSARRNGTRFALLYFDLDDFKYINDTFGHRAGDTVLVRTAGEVASLVRDGEMFARLGGDEFAILTELDHNSSPGPLAERVRHAIAALPFRFRGSNLRLTTSIGIALFPEHGDNTEDLVAHADTAMYQAKHSGKNSWALYDASRDLTEAMITRMNWVTRIAQAIELQSFELHFQGVYHTTDRRLSHLEALVRMKDPTRENALIMPGQFIPIAEKSGQILEIDRWVVRQSIAVLANHAALPALSVNISGRSFDDPGLPAYIKELLLTHQVEPSRLLIELTETAAVSEMQDAQRFIEALQQTGCIVCLDDFGTGFSTFAYLKYLGVEVLKIDGMFIRDLPNNKENQAFVKAMVDVGKGLKKITVAEFVEDAATFELLATLGVDLAQGYHLDRPGATHPALQSGT